MFIPSVSVINPNIYAQNVNRTSVCNSQPAFKGGLLNHILGVKEDRFEKSPDLQLPGLVNFTIDEYKKLSSAELETMRKDVDEYIEQNNKSIKRATFAKFKVAKDLKKDLDKDVKVNDWAAEEIKKSLDNTYGEGNYVFVPIGRSLSSVGKSLSYKIGEDNVKILPMSRAARFIDMSRFREDADKLNQYLDSIGLSKNEVETSGKTYIFSDFCDTGASKLGVKRLFESDYVWGEQPNVKFENVADILDAVKPDETQEGYSSYEKSSNYFNWAIRMIDYKPYSLVERCENLANTQEAVIKPENYSPVSKIFMFKLLDREMTKRPAVTESEGN